MRPRTVPRSSQLRQCNDLEGKEDQEVLEGEIILVSRGELRGAP